MPSHRPLRLNRHCSHEPFEAAEEGERETGEVAAARGEEVSGEVAEVVTEQVGGTTGQVTEQVGVLPHR